MVNSRPTSVLHSNLTPSLRSLSISASITVVGQAEIGDAVLQHAARLVERLEHGDVAAGLGHVGGAGHAGGTGADDADAEPVRFDVRQRCPAFGDGAGRRRSARAGRSPPARASRRPCTTPSHCVSCGQTRPHTAGSRLVAVIVVVGAAVILLGDLQMKAGMSMLDRAAADARLVRAQQAALRLDAARPRACSRRRLPRNWCARSAGPARAPACAPAESCGSSSSSPLPFPDSSTPGSSMRPRSPAGAVRQARPVQRSRSSARHAAVSDQRSSAAFSSAA